MAAPLNLRRFFSNFGTVMLIVDWLVEVQLSVSDEVQLSVSDEV